MPYKNKDKKLGVGKIFHAYNRGFKKVTVFIDETDFMRFMNYIHEYLDPTYKSKRESLRFDFDQNKYYDISKLTNKVELLGFCLMPNHFHLLVRTKSRDGMSDLIARISSRYTRYFNRKYVKEGALWGGTYKAVEIRDESQFRTVLKYIHDNPAELGMDITKYPYSSLKYYVGGYSNKLLTKGQPFK